MSDVLVRYCESPADLAVIKELFIAYQTSLPVDISFQNYQHEFANLPGNYSADNRGALFLAEQASSRQIVGCVAIRKIDEERCELKRLYVVPSARRLSVGLQLVQAAVKEAERFQYQYILLDTLSTMIGALRLYDQCGFKRVQKYYNNPIEDAVFLEKALQSS
jgi:ribosomal protein S18 acetylase RimI-like enzyme